MSEHRVVRLAGESTSTTNQIAKTIGLVVGEAAGAAILCSDGAAFIALPDGEGGVLTGWATPDEWVALTGGRPADRAAGPRLVRDDPALASEGGADR